MCTGPGDLCVKALSLPFPTPPSDLPAPLVPPQSPSGSLLYFLFPHFFSIFFLPTLQVLVTFIFFYDSNYYFAIMTHESIWDPALLSILS